VGVTNGSDSGVEQAVAMHMITGKFYDVPLTGVARPYLCEYYPRK
jgi:hypothetical protein